MFVCVVDVAQNDLLSAKKVIMRDEEKMTVAALAKTSSHRG